MTTFCLALHPTALCLGVIFSHDDVITPGLAVTYIRSTGEHAPATIIGCSTCGEDFIHLKYMRNGHEIEHHAPFDCVLFPIRSPSPSPGFWDMLSFGTVHRAVAPPCLSTRTLFDRHFPDLAGACGGGGGTFAGPLCMADAALRPLRAENMVPPPPRSRARRQ